MKPAIDVSFSLLLCFTHIYYVLSWNLCSSQSQAFQRFSFLACFSWEPCPFLHPSKRGGSFTLFGVNHGSLGYCLKCCCHHQRLMFPWQPGEVSSHEWMQERNSALRSCVSESSGFKYPPPPPFLHPVSKTNCSQNVYLVERSRWGEADQST